MDVNLPMILGAALVASASPGPATLAIAGASLKTGQRHGLALAAGVTTGSWVWSVAAALGLSAIMAANAWMLEVVRYLGAGYLLFMGLKSARSALQRTPAELKAGEGAVAAAYGRGLLLHLTNPKAVLFFGSLYAVGVPAGASPADLVLVIAAVGLQSALVFHGYALLFARPKIAGGYFRFRRAFEGLFAATFSAAGLRLLTARLT